MRGEWGAGGGVMEGGVRPAREGVSLPVRVAPDEAGQERSVEWESAFRFHTTSLYIQRRPLCTENRCGSVRYLGYGRLVKVFGFRYFLEGKLLGSL